VTRKPGLAKTILPCRAQYLVEGDEDNPRNARKTILRGVVSSVDRPTSVNSLPIFLRDNSACIIKINK